jgi:hypothetical protein
MTVRVLDGPGVALAPAQKAASWPLRAGLGITGLGALLGLGWLGLQVPPAPLPSYRLSSIGRGSVPIPLDVPPPVQRYYRAVFPAGSAPLVESAVLSGRGHLTLSGVTLPIRWRFIQQPGQAYRHFFEATWFGVPVFKVNEWYLDGHLRMDTPGGVLADDPLADRAANLALWAEALPSVLVTDARVRWETVDDTAARLFVPFGNGEDSFIVRFDQASGLLREMEVPRYRAETRATLPWLVNVDVDSYRAFGDLRLATVSSARWLDMARPWLTITLEEVVLNADVSSEMRAIGP